MPNHGTAAQYAAAAAAIPNGAVVASPGEIGALAFYCGTRCTVVDEFSDQARTTAYIEARTADAGPVVRWLLAVNFANREPRPPTRPGWSLSFHQDPAGAAAMIPTVTVWRGPQRLTLHRAP